MLDTSEPPAPGPAQRSESQTVRRTGWPGWSLASLRRAARSLSDWSRRKLGYEASGEMILLSGIVGAVTGVAAFLFVRGLTWLSSLTFAGLMNYIPPGAGSHQPHSGGTLDIVPWAIVLIPTVGGLISGWIVFTWCPEAEGHGSDAMVRSFHRLQGAVRARVPLLKGLASIITISSGGSAGREGPIAQVGAGIGSTIAGLLGLSADQRRFLLLAGAAGGIAAVFQAPLGAALFVCEVLYATTALETAAILYATVSAVSAYAVFVAIHGKGHEILAARGLTFHGLPELPAYVVFALVCAAAGYVYVRTFYGLRDHFFHRLPIPKRLKPALGGLLLGLFILAVRVPAFPTGIPHVMAGGYGWIQEAMDGRLTAWSALALLAFAKMLSTSLSISSGGSGGVFAPSLFIGAMLGAAYGHLCHHFFPGMVSDPKVFVLVGMGAFFAGVAKVPLTAVVMVSEMTGSFNLLVPLMLTSVLAHALLPRSVSLYEEQVNSLVDSPAHQGDFLVDVLANLRVGEVFDPRRGVLKVDESMPLSRLLRLISTVESNYFPVVNQAGRLVGIFSLSDLRGVLLGHSSGDLVVAADIAISPVITVTPEDDLHTALQRFTEKNIDEIPVVDAREPGKLLGMLRRKELIAAYHDEIERLRTETNGAAA